jgi:hypothetical protein
MWVSNAEQLAHQDNKGLVSNATVVDAFNRSFMF